MPNSGALDTGVKVIPHFPLVVPVEFSAKKRCNIIGFNGMDGCADDVLIDGLEIRLAFEHDVCGTLYLHEAPIVSTGEMANHGAEFLSELIQVLLKFADVNMGGQFLCFGKVIDGEEAIINLGVSHSPLVHFRCEVVVSVEVELQTEGSPGGHPHVTEAQVFDDEVEIVVETLAPGVLKECFPCPLIVPGLERGALLHCREDMHEPWMITTAGNDFLDAFIFAEVFATNELDFHTGISCDTFCVFADVLPARAQQI